MKKFLMLLIIAITSLSLMAGVAEAKRLGGGSSFGKQRSAPYQQSRKAPEAAPAKPASSGASKWLGPLAGLAIGAGLMSMFSGGGMGGGFSSLLMALLAAGVIMFLISKFKKPQPVMQGNNGAPMGYSNAPMDRTQQAQPDYAQPSYGTGTVSSMNSNIPQGFDAAGFIRNAKMSFIRLQAANDSKDLDDIRQYTTPEIFAEISMQMQERGNAIQKTEVININAELLDVIDDAVFSVASVRFTGQLSENGGPAESVDEIWNIQKHLHVDDAKWLLAGIQQTNR